MLVVIGVFLGLVFALSIGGLVISAIVQTVFSFILPVIGLLGLVLGFGTMVGKLITSLVSFFVKFIIGIVIFTTCVLPFIGRGWRNLYQAFPQIVNDIGWHFDHLRDGLEDAINQQGQWLIYLWGIILVPLYYISNQIQNATQNGNNANRNDDDDDYDGDYENDNHDGARQNRGGGNAANQQLPQHPRLYPVLPDININELDREEANNNDNDVGNVYLNNNNMNQVNGNQNDNDDRLCVICFNRERNTAVFPCGHTWLCEQCTNSVMSRNRLCPVCQQRIREYRTIFL